MSGEEGLESRGRKPLPHCPLNLLAPLPSYPPIAMSRWPVPSQAAFWPTRASWLTAGPCNTVTCSRAALWQPCSLPRFCLVPASGTGQIPLVSLLPPHLRAVLWKRVPTADCHLTLPLLRQRVFAAPSGFLGDRGALVLGRETAGHCAAHPCRGTYLPLSFCRSPRFSHFR